MNNFFKWLRNWNNKEYEQSTCLHDKCANCEGKGYKKDGSPCIHLIACKCKKCTIGQKHVNKLIKKHFSND
jgi:hypothetical protein